MDQIYHDLTKGVRRPKHKIALFLCGAAGSGKTSSREMFLKDAKIQTTFVTLNIDAIRPLVGSQEATRPVFQDLIDKTIQDGYSFLYDGTCRDKNNITRRIRELKEKGYKVILGITYASLGTVLGRVQRRIDQPLEDTIVRDIYQHLKNHVENYMTMDGIDEIYLYNNEKSTKLIFTRKATRVTCLSPSSNFYFDVSKYC
jgi:predicted ABC-type ATPase